MPKLLAIVSLLLCLGGWIPEVSGAEPQKEPAQDRWIIEGEVRYNLQDGTLSYTNFVTIKYGGATLTAQRAQLNQQTYEVVAEGDVRIQQESRVWYGERVEYNFRTKRLLGSEFRTGQSPFFVRGDALVGDELNSTYVLAGGLMTTDDYDKPGYSIRAKSVTIVPGEFIECEDAILYVGNTPVFWLPKLKRTLKRHPNHFVYVPGYRSEHGAYLLTTYEWYWNDRLDGAIHLDGRLKRGIGVGPDLNYHLPRFGEGSFKYYYAHDQEPGRDLQREPIDEDRQRIWFSHVGQLRTNLSLRSAVRYQTDSQIVRDFFETEYRENTQPSTYVELNQLWSNWSLNALGQVQVNDFQDTVERLPDVKLTGIRQKLGPTPFYYESESSAGYYQRQFAFADTNRFAAGRADTYHQVLLPWTFFGWLNVTPRAGGRFTHYSEASGPGGFTEEEDRTVFNTGAETSFKASRTWAGMKNDFFDIDGVRHIIRPSFNYTYVPNPSVDPRRLPQFDYELESAQLLPITFPDYNAVDSIDSQNVLRLGLENKWQTKRRGAVENFAHWRLYTDWRIQQNRNQHTFSDVYSKLELKPFDWLSFSSELSYNVHERDWDQANHAATLSPNDIWSWSLGQRYLRDGAFYTNTYNSELYGDPTVGTSLLFSSLYYRASQNWAARAQHYYNARDGFLQSQYYSIYRDLRSWTVAFTIRILRNDGGGTDWGGAITFSSKAAPRYQVNDDINKPTQLLGY